MNFNDTSHFGSEHLVSRSYDLTDEQISKAGEYIDDFNSKNTDISGYDLRNRQCASFAYGASQAAGIEEMKMSGWVTPASLVIKIKKLNGKNSYEIFYWINSVTFRIFGSSLYFKLSL